MTYFSIDNAHDAN